MKKFKDLFTVILFSAVIFAMTAGYIILPDGTVSYAERRKLSEFRELSAETVLSSEFSEKLEGYFLDQSPLRDGYRYLNTFVRMQLLFASDVNGLWTEDGHIFKLADKFDKKQVQYGTTLMNKVISDHLEGMNVYYSVIPDKNYFSKSDKPSFDYDSFFEALSQSGLDAEYIDIFDTLSLDKYYCTDSHWSQERILPVAKRLAEKMGREYTEQEYETKEIPDFYGVYYGQGAFTGIKPDTIRYLTNDDLENADVYGIPADILKEKFGVTDTLSKEVYALDKLEGMDAYDIFLSGGQPVVTVEKKEGNGRELVIFRDSFSSSLAPLMLGAYQKVTLVDLRYIPSKLLGDFVEFNENQDALFLYSASMLNSSMLMK